MHWISRLAEPSVLKLAKQSAELGWLHALLCAAYALCLSALVFTPAEVPSRTFLFYFVLPLAAVITPFAWRDIRRSTVLWAVGIYLLAMTLASLLDPAAQLHLVWRQFRISLLILIFLFVGGLLMVVYPRFLSNLLLTLCIAVAISAAVNVVALMRSIAPDFSEILHVRLIAVLGMQHYANSTNISATYAILAVAAVALVARGHLSRGCRVVLALAAAILLLAVALTQARSAMLAVTVGLGVQVWAGSRRTWLLAAAAALLGIALVIVVPEIAWALFGRGTSYRPDAWLRFLHLIAERPFIGFGSRPEIGLVLGDGVFHNQAHNLVLSAWFRGGILAALSMVFVLGAGIYWAYQYWRVQGEIAPLCIIVTITTAGMFDYQLLVTYPAWPWLTFWFPFGLCIGAEMAVRKLEYGTAWVMAPGTVFGSDERNHVSEEAGCKEAKANSSTAAS